MARPSYCCGRCPEVKVDSARTAALFPSGYDCTCRGNPRCPKSPTYKGRVRIALEKIRRVVLKDVFAKVVAAVKRVFCRFSGHEWKRTVSTSYNEMCVRCMKKRRNS